MRKRRSALLVILLVTVAASGTALTQSFNTAGRAVYGAGNNSCAQWTDARDHDTWATAGQWVLGFVSATAMYSRVSPAKTDARSIANWIDKYCLAHSGSDLSDGARELVELLLSGTAP